MNKQIKIHNLLNKMSNQDNFLSIDEAYLQSYRDCDKIKHFGSSVITDINQIQTLIKSVLADAGIKTKSNVRHPLLYLEVPKTMPFEKIIEFNIMAEEYLPCPFIYGVGYSNSNNIKLSLLTQSKNTNRQQMLQKEKESMLL